MIDIPTCFGELFVLKLIDISPDGELACLDCMPKPGVFISIYWLGKFVSMHSESIDLKCPCSVELSVDCPTELYVD